MKDLMRKALLVSACVLTAQSLQAQAANKTFFVPRSDHHQGGRTWALTAPHYMNYHQGGRFGFSTKAHVFHSSSDNKEGLGEYFGAAANADLSDAVGNAKVVVADGDATNALHGREVDHTYDLNDGGAASMGGTLNFAPTHKRTGVMLDFDWDMSKMLKGMAGWTIGINVPVVEVKNSLGLTITDSVPSDIDAGLGGTKKDAAGTVAEFFAGTYTQSTTTKNNQQALTHGRINANERKANGVADVKATFGYAFVTEHDSRVRLRAHAIVPTGNRSTGVDIFEAVYGNNHHYGLGLGGEGTLRLWNSAERKMSLWLSGAADYTFLFQGKEKRVAGLYDVANKKTAGWKHYALAVRDGQKPMFPAANKLVQDVNVTPGSHFDGTIGVTWAWKQFHMNFGYNVFYKQSEDTRLAAQWPVDRYGIVKVDYDADTAANFANTDAVAGPIQHRGKTTTTTGGAVGYQVDTDVCSGADQETHSFHLGAGYQGNFKKMSYSVNFTGSYEFAADKSKALAGWHVGGGVGVNF